jgi:hypothetical protein
MPFRPSHAPLPKIDSTCCNITASVVKHMNICSSCGTIEYLASLLTTISEPSGPTTLRLITVDLSRISTSPLLVPLLSLSQLLPPATSEADEVSGRPIAKDEEEGSGRSTEDAESGFLGLPAEEEAEEEAIVRPRRRRFWPLFSRLEKWLNESTITRFAANSCHDFFRFAISSPADSSPDAGAGAGAGAISSDRVSSCWGRKHASSLHRLGSSAQRAV